MNFRLRGLLEVLHRLLRHRAQADKRSRRKVLDRIAQRGLSSPSLSAARIGELAPEDLIRADRKR